MIRGISNLIDYLLQGRKEKKDKENKIIRIRKKIIKIGFKVIRR